VRLELLDQIGALVEDPNPVLSLDGLFTRLGEEDAAGARSMHRYGTRGILWLHRIRDLSSGPGALTLPTITSTAQAPVAPSATPCDERGVMRNVSWNLYNRLTDAIGERSSIRVAFDGKDVEIMVV
jgi:hypothetical protein